jgi:hypothetical protein
MRNAQISQSRKRGGIGISACGDAHAELRVWREAVAWEIIGRGHDLVSELLVICQFADELQNQRDVASFSSADSQHERM